MRFYLTPHEKDLVGLGRLELPTSPLSGVRSNQLSYKPVIISLSGRCRPHRSYTGAGLLPANYKLKMVELSRIELLTS